MRTSNRPMTPRQAFDWIVKNLSRPSLMNVVMDNDYTYVLKIGSAPRAAEYMQQNPAAKHLMSYAEFCQRFGFDSSTPVVNTTDAPIVTVPMQPTQSIDTDEVRKIADEVSKGHIAQAGSVFAEMIKAALKDSAQVEQVIEDVKEQVQSIVDRFRKPNVIEIHNPVTQERTNIGIQHFMFDKLLKACSARLHDGTRLNLFLVGPAGTGKTTATRKVADALGLQWAAVSSLDVKFELLGYKDANGQYQSTPFRSIWENGGVFTFDEISGSSEQALLAFNAALANGVCAFPDGMINRHPDCIIIAGDNVFDGATAQYSARNKLDAATLDRFVKLEWPIDEALEGMIANDPEWHGIVRKARQWLAENNVKGHIISPRATLYGKSLREQGFDVREVATMVLQKGMKAEQFANMIGAIL